MNSIQRSRGAQGYVRKHKIRKCPQHSCLYGLLWVLRAAASTGKGRAVLTALRTVLGYCLPLSTVFILCIIYYHEVSKQLSHHIIGYRDPGENADCVSGETVSALLRKSKREISLASVPFLVCLEGKGNGATQPSLPSFSSQLFLFNK